MNPQKGKSHHRSKLQIAKKKAKSTYNSWKSVYNPALKSDVLFTEWGWKHVTEKQRTGIEKINRLGLLPYAKKLIAEMPYYQRKRYQDHHDYYEFMGIVGGVRVVAVVQEYKKKYYFWTVYEKYEEVG